MNRGIVRFLPLLVVAVLLVGVVGYVSVKEIRTANKSAVLSDSDSGGSHDSGGTSGTSGSSSSGGSDSSGSGGSSGGSSGSTATTVKNEVETEANSLVGTKTEAEKAGTEASDVNEKELETEKEGLDNVGSLEVDIPDLSTELEAENKVLEQGILNEVQSTELQASEAGKPRIVRVEGIKNLKFLGLVPVTAPVTIDVNSATGEQVATISEPFLLKYLDFLFTR